jgi:hypothetical protein
MAQWSMKAKSLHDTTAQNLQVQFLNLANLKYLQDARHVKIKKIHKQFFSSNEGASHLHELLRSL